MPSQTVPPGHLPILFVLPRVASTRRHKLQLYQHGPRNVYAPVCLGFFGAFGHQKLLQTVKRSAFQSASIKFVSVKTIQNQHKHIIG
jgi:hypothetical protein